MPDHDTTPAPAYPLGIPATRHDTRFSARFMDDILNVLTRHGYPPVATGADLLRLQDALFRMIYLEDL